MIKTSALRPEDFMKVKFGYLFYKLEKFRAVPQFPAEINFAVELNSC